MESEVLEEEDLSVLAVLDSLLDLVSDAVVEEGDGRAEELLELLGLQKGSEKEKRRQRMFLVRTIWVRTIWTWNDVRQA